MKIDKLIEALLLKEEDKERMDLPPKTFEDDPMNFILKKYDNLNEILAELMSDNYKELLTGIYIIAYKPTSFKIVLHNGQYFFLTFMGEAYQATIAGKNYFLLTVGEKQRAMIALTRLLRWGNPLKTKGPEGAEQEASAEDATADTGETPPAETSAEETGGEEETLEESKILQTLIKESVSGQEAETLGVELWNASVIGKLPSELKEYEKVYEALKKYSKKYKTQITKFSGRREATTKFWELETGKSSDEPKTDLISTDEKTLRLSAKKGPAQLMSAAPKEARATILSAVKKSGLDRDMKVKLLSLVDDLAGSTKTEKLNTAELKKIDAKKIKSKVNIKARKVIDKATKAQNKLQDELRELFNNNAKFKTAFAYEAMTGLDKFGEGSPAEANFVIAFNNNFTDVKLEDISKISSPMVKKIADKCNLTVSFKSSSYKIKGEKAGYNFFSAVRVGLEDLVEKEQKLTEALKSKQINEGIFDKIKDFLSYIYDKFNSIMDYIKEGAEKIKQLIKEGIEKVMEFLGIEIEPNFNNEIDFYNLT